MVWWPAVEVRVGHLGTSHTLLGRVTWAEWEHKVCLVAVVCVGTVVEEVTIVVIVQLEDVGLKHRGRIEVEEEVINLWKLLIYLQVARHLSLPVRIQETIGVQVAVLHRL